MTSLSPGIQLCLKTAHSLDFKLHEAIVCFLLDLVVTGFLSLATKVPDARISPQEGASQGQRASMSSSFYPQGLTRGLEQSKNSRQTFVRIKKHPFCLRSCVLIMDLYYYTTLNMEICNLKRNPSWRKMPTDHFSSNHLVSRRQEMCSCSELSTD